MRWKTNEAYERAQIKKERYPKVTRIFVAGYE